MPHRILDSWPYAAAMVVGFLSWYLVDGLVLLPGADVDVKGFGILLVYVFYPLCLLVGALVLGFRRGYDWVTLVVCLVIYVGWPTVACALTGGDWATHWTDWGSATAAFFIPATQIGILAGLGLRRLFRAKKTATGATKREPDLLAG